MKMEALHRTKGKKRNDQQSSEEDNEDEDMSGLPASSQGEPSDEDDFDLEDLYEGSNLEIDALAEWPWIKAVNVFTESEGEKIGSCYGRINTCYLLSGH